MRLYSCIVIMLFLTLAGRCCATVMPLDECISCAIENNLDIKQEMNSRDISIYQERAARSLFFPTLSLIGTDLYIRNNPIMSRYGGLVLTQPLYSGGKLTNNLKASQENKNSKTFNLYSSMLLLENRVFKEYMNCLKYWKYCKAYDQAIERGEIQQASVQKDIKEGRRGEEESLRWKLLIDGYREKRVGAAQDLENAKIKLNTLMNREAAEPLEVADSHILRFEYADFMIRQMQYSREDMVSLFLDYALVFSPEYKKKMTDILIADYNYRATEATARPTVDMISNMNGRSMPNSGVYNSWDAGLYMNFDLYRQVKQENIKISQLQLEASRITEQRFLRDLKSNVRTLYLTNAAWNEQVSLLRKQQKNSREYLREITTKYAGGAASNLDVIEAFSSFYTTQFSLVDAIINAFTQFDDLVNLVGFSFVFNKPSPNVYWRYREKGLKLDYTLKGLNDPLFRFMDNGDFEKVKLTFDGTPSLIKSHNSTGQTALHYAADRGYVKCAEFLLSRGADPDALNFLDGTPMLLVICFCPPEKKLAFTQLLISHGADVNKVSHHYSPLCWAAMKNELDVAKELVKAGAEINDRDEFLHLTPLHYAAMWGNVEMAAFLLEKGADLSAVNADNLTPYDLAWQFEHKELLDFLEKKGAK